MYKKNIEHKIYSNFEEIIKKNIKNKNIISVKYLYGTKPYKVLIKVRVSPTYDAAKIICNSLNRSGYQALIMPYKRSKRHDVLAQHHSPRSALKYRQSLFENRFRTIIVEVNAPDLPDGDTHFPNPYGD